ncbi:hypothetical protein [Micromonospora sp. KLBMP9576]|uniref:hypothetical protein n=1 Tax=Micromonospora sp. KLBMP9576 TaxID=3424769 RepID=UPI003D91ECE2
MPNEFSANSPSDYNSSAPEKTFVIYPNAMYQYAHRWMPGVIADIEENWKSIGDVWEELKLGWTGSSSEAAKEFNDRLQTAQNEMFGKKGATEDQDQPGIMRLSRAVAVHASASYYEAEMTVTKIFDDFLNELGAPAEPGAQVPQDVDGGPISIHYDNHNGVRYDNRDIVGQWQDSSGGIHLLYEGEKTPKPELTDFTYEHNGETITVWAYGVEETRIDEEGKAHKEIYRVEAATWVDDRGETHRLSTEGTTPLPLPPGVG